MQTCNNVDSSVSIATGYGLDGQEKSFLFTIAARLALRPTSYPLLFPWGGVRLSPLCMLATLWPTAPSLDDR
jgi:hypothetical protein